MAIRTITWTVDEDMRVSPTRVQNAGVQGDDNATRVVFSLPAFLQTGHKLYIEYVDGVSGYDKTDPLDVVDGAVGFDLPLKWTQHGGESTVRLVATKMIDNVETLVAHSKPECRIRFDGRAKAFAKIKSLIEGSIQAAQDRIAKMIADAKVWIDNVNGVYVGGGEMPDSAVIQIDPEGEALLLDNAMSDTSENVPKTKVVKTYVDKLAKESTSYPGCFYRTVNGATEWLNPPMMVGVEYRTVERYQGEPVYVKMVNLGIITVAEGSRSIYPNIKSVSHLMGLEVHSLSPDTQRSYAYGFVTNLRIYAGTDPSFNVYLNVQRFDTDANEEIYVTVKYTKTTDNVG